MTWHLVLHALELGAIVTLYLIIRSLGKIIDLQQEVNHQQRIMNNENLIAIQRLARLIGIKT